MVSKEMFRDIENYEGYYQVSNKGKVKSLDRIIMRRNGKPQPVNEKILKLQKDKNGYLRVALCKNSNILLCRVGRLVAQAFILNPKNKPTVNHKSGIKSDDNISNLEWATHSENTQHAFDNGLNIFTDERKNKYKIRYSGKGNPMYGKQQTIESNNKNRMSNCKYKYKLISPSEKIFEFYSLINFCKTHLKYKLKATGILESAKHNRKYKGWNISRKLINSTFQPSFKLEM